MKRKVPFPRKVACKIPVPSLLCIPGTLEPGEAKTESVQCARARACVCVCVCVHACVCVCVRACVCVCVHELCQLVPLHHHSTEKIARKKRSCLKGE